MLRVTSTVPQYLALLDVAPGDRERAWVRGYEQAYADLFEMYYAGYGHRDGRPAAVALVPDLAPEISEREARALLALEHAASDFEGLGLLPGGTDLHVTLMVGTGHSNAWVRPVDGTPVLFVALELLPPEGYDDILVVHELVHVVQLQALLPALARRAELENHLGLRIWLEGLAVAATRKLLPDRPAHHYFFVAGYDWPEQCRAALPQIAPTLLRNLEVCDATLTYSFVGVTDGQAWPSRAGYWIGDQVVTEIMQAGTELDELLGWQPERIVQTLRTSALLMGRS
ncbi:hypothetical protein [Serinicoccus marinus]|uniref:hypothetical protein n=1 Tax=Serinicoccus marinus TaxID=247333 RepID=UPI00249215DC|nr:hypothetical protein [Serinicoccus marinus]